MYFLVLFGDWKLFLCDKNLFKIFTYLCIYFLQKIAELVLERLPLLGNGWSYRVARPLVELHFFNVLSISVKYSVSFRRFDFRLKYVVKVDF